MTAKEFRKHRLALGLSTRAMAEKLRLGRWGERTVRRWEAGDFPVPGPVALAIDYMVKHGDE